jgi:uncharacterized protein (DUF608 family)
MNPNPQDQGFSRRDFLRISAISGVAAGAMGPLATVAGPGADLSCSANSTRDFNAPYTGVNLNRVAFPLGGIGAGMVCLEGTGAVSHVSLRNHPDVFNEPCSFAAIAIRGPRPIARVLEGQVPGWKAFGMRDAALGLGGASFGLPRCTQAEFEPRFPFATITLHDELLPLDVQVTGWSPFTPGDADSSSLPVVALEYRFTNWGNNPIEAVFSHNVRNFMVVDKSPRNAVRPATRGFVLWGAGAPEKPWEEGYFSASVPDEPAVKVNHAWFRGGAFDPLTMAWEDVETGACFERAPVTDEPAPGGSLFVPFKLLPEESKTIKLLLCWYVPRTNLRINDTQSGFDPSKRPANGQSYQPWYAGRFAGIEAVAAYWAENYADLRRRSEDFAHCFYDTSLPPEIVEAVASNLAILKSPTVLRQLDGRMWAWEGSGDDDGCCFGSCTHVWNYAQAVPHLFPALERTLRETEFGPSLDKDGYQLHRALLPSGPIPAVRDDPAAADGQLGCIMKVHREWRISGDTEWMRRLWPQVIKSLNYCIETWDPNGKGWLEEPHLNTYDIEFWGPNGMCTSIYLGALRAAVVMGNALGDETSRYQELYERGVERVERELFDGEYFVQKIEWKSLRAAAGPAEQPFQPPSSPEGLALREKEGPKYQYGSGCLSDGVIGAWMAQVCGVGDVLDQGKVTSHLQAVHRHNLKSDLSAHANPQRPTYALGRDGGLLICTWPKGGALSLPFIYSNEVWTGIEYQVASHLMMVGAVREGLEIVRTCRKRYDGRVRNPFDEYECGHWYARALSSYALLQGWSGARYDAVEKVLHLRPSVAGDFRCFISTATGYGSVGVRDGKPFLEVKSGRIDVSGIKYVSLVAA